MACFSSTDSAATDFSIHPPPAASSPTSSPAAIRRSISRRLPPPASPRRRREMVSGTSSDVMRHALRSLLKAKGFTAVAVATIALGVGANTAVFSVVDAVLLRPLPFKDADRIYTLTGSNPKRDMQDATISYPQFVEL